MDTSIGSRGSELLNDGQKLVDAVRATVPGADRLQAALDKRLAQIRIVADGAKMPLHLGFVLGHQKILADPEQALRVAPRRGDERDAAGERLEHADRRNARQHLDVEAARHMHRGEMAREDLGGLGVREPSPIARAVAPERIARVVGVAHAVDVKRQADGSGRAEKKVLQLAAALVVAPVADPDEAGASVPSPRVRGEAETA